jgi:coproporphyrinogen III oxidase-like Fe-S oxidoreductase
VVEDMLARCLQMLVDAGFEQYEVSGYARPGAQCRHNLNYWTFGDYLGVGAGAHGKISDPERGVITRTQQWREPRRYLGAEPGSAMTRNLPAADLPFEFAMNGFRLVAGFSDELFEERTGLGIETLKVALDPLVARGLVARSSNGWRATPRGFRFLNEILVQLLPNAPIAQAS